MGDSSLHFTACAAAQSNTAELPWHPDPLGLPETTGGSSRQQHHILHPALQGSGLCLWLHTPASPQGSSHGGTGHIHMLWQKR